MIKHPSEMATRIVEGVRGGNGKVSFLDLMTTDESLGKFRVCSIVTLEKGCSIGEHTHGPDAEIYIIISGKAVVNDNGTVAPVTAGDVIYTGDGAFHSISNEEDEAVKLFAIVIN